MLVSLQVTSTLFWNDSHPPLSYRHSQRENSLLKIPAVRSALEIQVNTSYETTVLIFFFSLRFLLREGRVYIFYKLSCLTVELLAVN